MVLGVGTLYSQERSLFKGNSGYINNLFEEINNYVRKIVNNVEESNKNEMEKIRDTMEKDINEIKKVMDITVDRVIKLFQNHY